MNTEDFVTYEQALALKKLGFNEETFTYYDEDNPKIKGLDDFYEYHLIDYNRYSISAPTLSEAQKWIRKNTKYSVEAYMVTLDEEGKGWSYLISHRFKESICSTYPERNFNSYEEALSTGITECLKSLQK